MIILIVQFFIKLLLSSPYTISSFFQTCPHDLFRSTRPSLHVGRLDCAYRAYNVQYSVEWGHVFACYTGNSIFNLLRLSTTDCKKQQLYIQKIIFLKNLTKQIQNCDFSTASGNGLYDSRCISTFRPRMNFI